MGIKIRWLGTACFEIRLPSEEVIVIDPYLDEAINSAVRSSDIERADLICVTHGHFDHILDVGSLANRLGSTVICGKTVAENIQDRLNVPEKQIQATTVGETLKHGNLKIEVVKAIHVDNRRYFASQLGITLSDDLSTEDVVKMLWDSIEDDEIKNMLVSYLGKYPGGEQLNFVFQLLGNVRMYFCGSFPSPELFTIAEQAGAQILILQILLGYEEMAYEFARRVGASIVIPSHHDAFIPGQKTPDLQKVQRLFDQDPEMNFMAITAGKWYEINHVFVEGH